MNNKMKNKLKNNDQETLLAKWMEGKISDLELKKLISKEDFIAYQKIKKGIELYEVIEKPLEKSYAEFQEKLTNAKNTKIIDLYKKWAFSIAAVLLLFFGLNYFFKAHTINYKSGIGEQKKNALLDGSEVFINANSSLTYKKNFKTNRVLFLNGEAFFKVKKEKKPFIVKTKNGIVKVLGTQFTVVSRDDYFEVKCYKGKVQVQQNNISKILLPHFIYRKINQHKMEVLQESKNTPYWLKGETHFESTPAKYVFTALKNQYGLKIISKNIDDATLFTGTFPNKNKKVALDIVTDALQLKYKLQNNSVILLKK